MGYQKKDSKPLLTISKSALFLTITAFTFSPLALVTPVIGAPEPVATNSSDQQAESTAIEFDHPISARDAFEIAKNNDFEVQSVGFKVGNGVGSYIYDSSISLDANIQNLEENLQNQAPGGNAAVNKLTVVAKDSASTTAARSSSASNDLLDDARGKPPQDAGDADLTRKRDQEVPKTKQQNRAAAVKDKARSSEPPTRAHANSVWFETKDNVDGKRQVLINADWLGKSNLKNAPDPLRWGLEFQLYQWNYSLDGKNKRPTCPIGTNKQFWANASLAGATMTAVINDGEDHNNTYIDNDHAFDSCQMGAIGFGIQHAKGVSDLDLPLGGGLNLHQTIFVDMRLNPGDKPWSHISANSKFVSDNCAGLPAESSCMNLFPESAPWPLDGNRDMLLLNSERKWKTPAHFNWDEFEDKRPKAITP